MMQENEKWEWVLFRGVSVYEQQRTLEVVIFTAN